MNRDWFIMAASTVSFYTNEEAYNKTNIQESFQKLSFSNKNLCFSLKIAVFYENLSFISYSAGDSSANRTGESCCKQQFSFPSRFECLKILWFFEVYRKIQKFQILQRNFSIILRK